MHILKIENLTVEVEGKTILKNFNLTIKSGEVHAIMGPNGTGKSTLSKVIMGDPLYHIIKGHIYYDDILLNDLAVDERARLGLFLGVQLPQEIEGVTNADFLRTAVHAKEGEDFKLFEFVKELERLITELKMDKEMIHRSINMGFSGGERKKNEILQMYLLKPSMVMLDEIDSGLDVDSLKIVGESGMKYFQEYQPGLLLITHYKRLLDYIKPTHVHIMKDGAIVQSGDFTLVSEVERLGYDKINTKTSTCIVKENIIHE